MATDEGSAGWTWTAQRAGVDLARWSALSSIHASLRNPDLVAVLGRPPGSCAPTGAVRPDGPFSFHNGPCGRLTPLLTEGI